MLCPMTPVPIQPMRVVLGDMLRVLIASRYILGGTSTALRGRERLLMEKNWGLQVLATRPRKAVDVAPRSVTVDYQRSVGRLKTSFRMIALRMFCGDCSMWAMPRTVACATVAATALES